MSERTLVSIRRTVAVANRADYDLLWGGLRDAVVAAGAHAWRFRSASDPACALEFLEFGSVADPRGDATVAAAIRRLDRLAPAVAVEEWIGG